MTDKSDDLRTRIAAVAEAHEPCGLSGGIDCNCGQGFRPDSGSWVERAVGASQLWSQHVADAVIRELGMRREWLVFNANGGGRICDSERLARVLLNQPVRPPGVEDPGRMPYVAVEVRYVTEWTTTDTSTPPYCIRCGRPHHGQCLREENR